MASSKLKTVVAETVFLGREAFETLGPVEVIPDRQIKAEHLRDADILMIRSKTTVTPDLLKDTSIRFVATATAGFEHMDCNAMDQQKIGWCAAPGCNADSVGDYMTAALLLLHTCHGIELEGKTMGIIGVGNVGSRVAVRARALGLRVILNDPPRAAQLTAPHEFQSLDTLLAESDIVTLHVPLISDGPWPTRRMADASFFNKMKKGSILFNASRGKVLDADALLHAKTSGILRHAMLDVWDPEPQIRPDVLAISTLGTPHIAGHSFEGKLNGTIQAYQEACRFFRVEPTWDYAPLLPALTVPTLTIDSRGKTDLEVFAEAVHAVYDLSIDHLTPEKISQFDKLRSNYWIRREFKNTVLSLSENRPELLARIIQAGFSPLSTCKL